jgi:ribosomal protein S18 acetylase RimI-like enzyme
VSSELTLRRVHGEQVIPHLEPLYLVLQEHQAAIAPSLARMPARSPKDAWQLRSTQYRRWLAMPGAFVLLAEHSNTLIGYALVSPDDPYQGWNSDGDVGDILDIVVSPGSRDQGIGRALLDGAERELRRVGIAYVRLRVLAANADALRLYERRSMEIVSNVLLRRIDTTH